MTRTLEEQIRYHVDWTPSEGWETALYIDGDTAELGSYSRPMGDNALPARLYKGEDKILGWIPHTLFAPDVAKLLCDCDWSDGDFDVEGEIDDAVGNGLVRCYWRPADYFVDGVKRDEYPADDDEAATILAEEALDDGVILVEAEVADYLRSLREEG